MIDPYWLFLSRPLQLPLRVLWYVVLAPVYILCFATLEYLLKRSGRGHDSWRATVRTYVVSIYLLSVGRARPQVMECAFAAYRAHPDAERRRHLYWAAMDRWYFTVDEITGGFDYVIACGTGTMSAPPVFTRSRLARTWRPRRAVFRVHSSVIYMYAELMARTDGRPPESPALVVNPGDDSEGVFSAADIAVLAHSSGANAFRGRDAAS